MNLQQLRYVCEIVERGMSVSRAAAALHTSQPSMSRQIQSLEKELGVTVFVRSRRRILGLSKPGEEVHALARQVVRDTERLRHVGREYLQQEAGTLVVTTSHTHARYVLPKVIREFARRHPRMRVTLRQGNPTQVAQWVSAGEADLSICSIPTRHIPGTVLIPCYDQHKVVLTPNRHPLLKAGKLTLAALAKHPLITYDPEFTTYGQVMQAFADAGLVPHIALSATDVDVMKTYVKEGLGVAIMAGLAFDPKEDTGLAAIDARHLFASNKIYVGVQRQAQLRDYALDFISLFSPGIDLDRVRLAVQNG